MTSPPAEIQAEAQPSAEVTGAYWVQADALRRRPGAGSGGRTLMATVQGALREMTARTEAVMADPEATPLDRYLAAVAEEGAYEQIEPSAATSGTSSRPIGVPSTTRRRSKPKQQRVPTWRRRYD